MVGSQAVVVGGGGHVGLRLAIALADAGVPTVSLDIDHAVVRSVSQGSMPFSRQGPATDPYVRDNRPDPLDKVLADSDVLVIGAPHSVYRDLVFRQPVLDNSKDEFNTPGIFGGPSRHPSALDSGVL